MSQTQSIQYLDTCLKIEQMHSLLIKSTFQVDFIKSTFLINFLTSTFLAKFHTFLNLIVKTRCLICQVQIKLIQVAYHPN